ncbi:MAG: acetyl-CoA carboxylase, biotin carboxyl carrier protein [Candidatus Marinimicrobia bacterium]|nr:acetyl-CoA carboxylase, biotin carboxyl carrier protein [Candidatus Neomarinimicrobiota bacterium]
MWQDKIKEIIYLLENSTVNEIDLTFWGRRFRVVKSPPEVLSDDLNSDSTVRMETPISSDISEPPSESSPKLPKDRIEVFSPMPGTFYRSPGPDKDPFVKEGDQVAKGDTLCIIEAMKIMNEIEVEFNGVIQSVLVKEGAAVEYDQPLFILSSSS